MSPLHGAYITNLQEPLFQMTNKKLAMIVVTLIMQSHLHMISIAEKPTKNKQNKYVKKKFKLISKCKYMAFSIDGFLPEPIIARLVICKWVTSCLATCLIFELLPTCLSWI